MRNRINQETDRILEKSLDELIKYNRLLANELESALYQEAKPAEEESAMLVGAIDVLRTAHETFTARLSDVQNYDFVAA
jgi:hypothetical protein